MADAPTPQPRFRRPPVVETILGVHFRPSAGFNVVQQVRFWEQFQDEFPIVEHKTSVEETREKFGENVPRGVELRWSVADKLPFRLWARSADGKHTLQIQSDALLVNWQRDPANPEPYLNYGQRRERFVGRLAALNDFFGQHNMGSVEPTSCFVTYINHIPMESLAAFPQHLERTLTVWRDESSDGWLPEIDSATLRFSYPMPNDRGRLHALISPAFQRNNNTWLMRLELIGRANPGEKTIPAAVDSLDLGHDWVVRGFASMTRPEMHQQWERYHE